MNVKKILLVAVVSLAALVSGVSAADFEYGDVFAGVYGGKVMHYAPNGTLKATYDVCGYQYVTGMAFDSDGNLYVTCFSKAEVVKVQRDTGTVLSTISTGTQPESVVFDASGNFYVGHAGGDYDIRKFNSSGVQTDSYDVAPESRGSDWIDLASDQCTMFYTSEGRKIMRYDVCNDTQLSDWTVVSSYGTLYALRILPGGGVLVADSENVKRLNSSGAIVQIYDLTGFNSWFALNLDPDGKSFWSGDFSNGKFVKFNISTGNAETIIDTGQGGSSLFGLAVFGEITVSKPVITISIDPATATNTVGDTHTVTVTVQKDGSPLSGVTVYFEVISGPNAGESGSAVTNASGQATFSYTGSGGSGTDVIVAKYSENGSVYRAKAIKKWVSTSIPEFPPVAVGILGALGAVVLFATRRD
ncbi:hypothetical protein [Geoglobus ahangari]